MILYPNSGDKVDWSRGKPFFLFFGPNFDNIPFFMTKGIDVFRCKYLQSIRLIYHVLGQGCVYVPVCIYACIVRLHSEGV